MNIKERIMAVLRREEPDVIPCTNYLVLMRLYCWGNGERELRNMGLGLVDWAPSHRIVKSSVKVEATRDWASWSLLDRFLFAGSKHVVYRTFTTPVGSVSTKDMVGLSMAEWPMEWMIKDLPDYDVVKFIVEDTEYGPDYEAFLERERVMGKDGVVWAVAPKSPLMEMLHGLMGYRRFFLDYFMHREEFGDLYSVISKKELELYRIIADAPAEVVWMGDNLNGIVIGPKLFEKYCVPFYNKAAQILHKKGKILAVHMDGKLKCLRDLIPKTEIDVVEAFTPPPLGDLPIKEAREAWKKKFVISTNFPAPVCFQGPDEVRKKTIDILRSVAPGDNFMLGITEDIPINIFEESLRTIIKTVMKHGAYPISIE